MREFEAEEAGPGGKRRRDEAAEKAVLARLVKSLLQPAYQRKEIGRDEFKATARAVTALAKQLAAAGQLPQQEDAMAPVLASLVQDELARLPRTTSCSRS